MPNYKVFISSLMKMRLMRERMLIKRGLGKAEIYLSNRDPSSKFIFSSSFSQVDKTPLYTVIQGSWFLLGAGLVFVKWSDGLSQLLLHKTMPGCMGGWEM